MSFNYLLGVIKNNNLHTLYREVSKEYLPILFITLMLLFKNKSSYDMNLVHFEFWTAVILKQIEGQEKRHECLGIINFFSIKLGLFWIFKVVYIHKVLSCILF